MGVVVGNVGVVDVPADPAFVQEKAVHLPGTGGRMESQFIAEQQQFLGRHTEAQAVVHVDAIVPEGHAVPHGVIPEVPAGQVELTVRDEHRSAAREVIGRLPGRDIRFSEQIELRVVEEQLAGRTREEHSLAGRWHAGLVFQGHRGNAMPGPPGHDRPVVAGFRDHDDRPVSTFALENALAAEDEMADPVDPVG